jgi:hypothetical protein
MNALVELTIKRMEETKINTTKAKISKLMTKLFEVPFGVSRKVARELVATEIERSNLIMIPGSDNNGGAPYWEIANN